jgi:hypothetical protein
MGYTAEERKQIAAGIRAYAQRGIIHSIQDPPEWLKRKGADVDVVELSRTATTADVRWLDMVARDVEGLIDHES